jgi:hypothetical protein
LVLVALRGLLPSAKSARAVLVSMVPGWSTRPTTRLMLAAAELGRAVAPPGAAS